MPAQMNARFCTLLVAMTALLFGSAAGAEARGGNYLIVTAEEYNNTAALNEFVAAKTAQGFTVSTYVVSSGTSNTAIRTYIQGLWGGPDSPDYILLVGDTDGSTAGTDTIPHWTGQASRHACTDVYYACMDSGDDWYPEIPIGRFSVRSPSALQDVIDKTLYVEAGAFSDPTYTKRAAFLATSDSTSGAAETHDWVIDNLLTPDDFTCTKIYAAEGGGTSDITNAVNNGCMFVTYGGHSGSSGWSEPYFSQSHVQALTNQDMYGLVFGWSCNSANYAYNECFGETWQRVADSGAAAYLSASALIFWGSWEAWEPSRQLETYFYRTMFEDQEWEVGVAWHYTRYKLLLDYGAWDGNHAHPPSQNEDVCRNFFEEFILLGDPSLLLPCGNGFTVEAEPAMHDVCTTTTDDVVYTIQVNQLGDYTKTVKLSCVGKPVRATVDFSVDEIAPPFTSTLTVGNLSDCTTGTYELTIKGTTVDLERQVKVMLYLADDAPGLISLNLPLDGASDVSRTPTFEWDAAAQAAQYEIEVATDAGFSTVVRHETITDTTYTPSARLEGDTVHYWHVRGLNGCGDGIYSTAFTFTTLDQADYFTEQYDNNFDIEGLTVAYIPDGSGDYYEFCGGEVETFNTDPAGGTVVAPGEDGSITVNPASVSLWLYGVEYDGFHINSNGNLTFTGGDSTWQETLAIHFNRPRISGLFDDFSPQNGGTISWKQLADRIAVTYENVPEYSTNNDNTFQIEMYFNGEIHITWLSIEAADGIVGLSAGDGLPGDFLETDFSAAPPCGSDFVISATPPLRAVCTPAEAVYTVDIQPLQGFEELVTLSVDGLPAGATVDFSDNPIMPPGTSVMTISDTDLAAAGDYTLEIIGTAPSVVKSRFVDLSIDHAVADQITLLTPTNGATAVSLTPALTWEADAAAAEYDLEIATDAGFVNVVYSATVDEAAHAPSDPLGGAVTHYWRVRGVNACGVGDYSGVFSFTTVDRVMPVSYDMLNGEDGSYTYFDDAYDGDGDNTVELAPLSHGLGDLTDGVIATEHWNVTSGPYVGWVSVDPTITFHFDGTVNIETVTLYLDDAGGGGGVEPPEDVIIVMGDDTLEFACSDPPGDEPFAFVLDDLGLTGDILELTLADYSTSGYFMLSEVEFEGASQTPCFGDLDGDRDVDLADLAQLLGNYGVTSGAVYEDGDLDTDGDVDLSDLATLLSLYGTTCP